MFRKTKLRSRKNEYNKSRKNRHNKSRKNKKYQRGGESFNLSFKVASSGPVVQRRTQEQNILNFLIMKRKEPKYKYRNILLLDDNDLDNCFLSS